MRVPVLELDGSNANAYFNRGSTYDSMGQYDKAIADYTRALEIDKETSGTRPPTRVAASDTGMGPSSIGSRLHVCVPVCRRPILCGIAATAALAAVNAARTRKLQAGK